MKNQLKTLVVLFSFLCLGIVAQAQLTIAMVDYMNVPEGMGGDYLSVEQDIWKPMHQEYVNQGKLWGWFLYAIPYPGGTNAEYHYVTVRIYNNLADIENPMSDMADVFGKVHAGKDANKAFEKTLASRDLVKTYGFAQWESFMQEGATSPAEILTVVYFKVPPGKGSAYQEVEKTIWHPLHKANMDAGRRMGWGGWRLARPQGTSLPFQYVAVDHYKDWEQYTKPPVEGILEQVHPGKTWEELNAATREALEMVNFEEWRLIDYVMKQE